MKKTSSPNIIKKKASMLRSESNRSKKGAKDSIKLLKDPKTGRLDVQKTQRLSMNFLFGSTPEPIEIKAEQEVRVNTVMKS